MAFNFGNKRSKLALVSSPICSGVIPLSSDKIFATNGTYEGLLVLPR